jgi:poly-gamma-glutamate capsule biosynthesis protein CapA/YwtB (metallophosphatase superfamily)
MSTSKRVVTATLVLAALGVFACTSVAASPAAAPASMRPAATDASASVPPTGTTVPTATPVATITLTAVGDMCFDSAPKRLIQSSGADAPFAAVVSRLRTADVTVGNLECPLSSRGHAVANKAFTFQGDPRAAKGLAWAGFDLVSLANNHTGDYGSVALRDTFKILGKAKVAWAGAGVNKAAAWKPATITRKGARIAYLGFCEIGPSYFVAGTNRPGSAYTLDTAAVQKAIRAARKNADYVIVQFHWGIERNYTPTSRQVRDGRAAINAGASIVVSCHPHVVQGVEFYKHGLIAYSLGNFIFSPGSSAGRDSVIFHATLSPTGVSGVSVEPVYIGQNGRPTPQTGATAKRILGIVSSTSRGRGTKVHVSGSTAHLTP